MTLDDLRNAYKNLEPAFEEMRSDLESLLEAEAKRLGIAEARIEGRVKAVHKFLSKTARKQAENEWDAPLVDCRDKVGVRADVVYLDDALRLADALASNPAIEVVCFDDKGDTELGDNTLGYRGIHLDVRPASLPEGVPPEFAVCEIQVRTNAQAAWSMAFHDLSYKPVVELSRDEKRSINRLTALMELFDDAVRDIRAQIMGKQGYPVAIVIRALEAIWTSHGGVGNDRASTVARVSAVLPDLNADDAHQLSDALTAWAEERHEQLETAFAQIYVIDFLHQPESVLLMYQITQDPFEAPTTWTTAVGMPFPQVERIASLVNETVPAPS